MRLHRSLTVLFAPVALVVLLTAQPAAAEPYPAVPPDVAVSESVVEDDGSVIFTGDGFLPGENVNVDLTYTSSNAAGVPGQDSRQDSRQDRPAREMTVTAYFPVPEAFLRTVVASSDGTFATPVTLTRLGTAVLTALGLTSGATASATVRVVTGDGSGLAATGNDGRRLALEVGGGLLTITLGGLLVWFAAHRRRQRVDA